MNWLEMMAVQLTLDSFRRHTAEEQSSVEMQKLDNDITLQQGRGNDVLPTVLFDLGDITTEQIQGHCNTSCSHPREKECVSRRPVKRSSGGLDNRMEFETGDSESDFTQFSIPSMDLFATRENRKLQVFCSPFPDQSAWAVSLIVTWKGMFAYAFPHQFEPTSTAGWNHVCWC
jgi:hypothetical protein